MPITECGAQGTAWNSHSRKNRAAPAHEALALPCQHRSWLLSMLQNEFPRGFGVAVTIVCGQRFLIVVHCFWNISSMQVCIGQTIPRIGGFRKILGID